MKIKYLNNASDCYQSWSEGKDFIESIEEKEVNLIQKLDLETFKTKKHYDQKLSYMRREKL